MGNEHSYMTGLQIDQKAIEVSEFFTHYSAYLTSVHPSNLSVFVGERLVGGSLWQTQTPLEKISKVNARLGVVMFLLKTAFVAVEFDDLSASVHIKVCVVVAERFRVLFGCGGCETVVSCSAYFKWATSLYRAAFSVKSALFSA